MTDVRMPDGTVITNVPEGTTQSELMRRYKLMQEQQVSGGQAFGEQAQATFLENIAGAPAALGRAAAAGLEFVGPFASPQLKAGLRNIPSPSAEDILATADAARKSLLTPGLQPFDFAEQKQKLEQQKAARQEQRPFATGAGKLAGDAFTIMTARLPAAPGIVKLERILKGVDPRPMKTAWDPVRKFLTGSGMRTLLRGTGRSIETGAEAALLDVLKGDDPMETAAVAAGAQAAGSVGLQIAKKLAGDPKAPLAIKGLKLAGWAAGGWAVIQMAKQLIPGGDPSEVRELAHSMVQSIDKILLGLGAGMVAAAVGGGRIRDLDPQATKGLIRWADAATSLPRGAIVSFWESLLDADPVQRDRAAILMEKIVSNPAWLDDNMSEQLAQAAEQGRFIEEMNRMMIDDKEFNRKMFELLPPAFGNGE